MPSNIDTQDYVYKTDQNTPSTSICSTPDQTVDQSQNRSRVNSLAKSCKRMEINRKPSGAKEETNIEP